jgi:hypothetical protein
VALDAESRDQLGVAEVALRVREVFDLAFPVDGEWRHRSIGDTSLLKRESDVLPEVTRRLHEDDQAIEAVLGSNEVRPLHKVGDSLERVIEPEVRLGIEVASGQPNGVGLRAEVNPRDKRFA